MIATTDQIIAIIKENPNRDYISKYVEYNKNMRTHLYGESIEGKIKTIDGMEDQALRNLRAKYVKSNKDLFARLGRNIDKVFSARGGSIYYNMTEQLDKRALNMSSDIRDGYSVKKWVENYWLPHLKDDPGGIIFMEIGNGIQYPVGKAYPTYKCISDIYDYPPPNGSSLEYVAFKLSDSEKKAYNIEREGTLFRFVDDANDYLVLQNNQEIDILRGETIPNYFQVCPAITNSDIVSGKNEKYRVGFYDDVMELAEHFLLKGSIKVTHEFLHGFPKYWEYADDCNNCHGVKMVDGKECPTCKGSGKNVMVKVSDVKILNPPVGKDDAVIAPNVAGYVEPSETYYNISTRELSVLEDVMNYTLWGVSDKKRAFAPLGANNKTAPEATATEVIDDHQPMIARLSGVSESAEKRHKFIVDMCVLINLKQPDYLVKKGSSVNYGRRYLILNEDEVWQKYSDARKSNAPKTILNDLLRDFIETKYAGDPISKAINLKLLKVEPFVHMDDNTAKNLIENDLDLIQKLYFWEWADTLSLAEVMLNDVAQLKEMLKIYATEKMGEVKIVRQEKADQLAAQKPSLN